MHSCQVISIAIYTELVQLLLGTRKVVFWGLVRKFVPDSFAAEATACIQALRFEADLGFQAVQTCLSFETMNDKYSLQIEPMSHG
ncbi:hypothetical protein V6N11_070658 [Hibiscus sabdariffa]|uniref:RNase H type-1 domain-containing protein n=1 Tax=Hibiscus sabdariffa TaxID=183260 RepID=A0ABR2QG86_9ROSI